MVSAKNILRSLIVLASVLVAGFLGLWFLGGSNINVKNQNISAVKIPEDRKEADRFSDFGGATPEETLKLLISALEKNDLILAVKYFIPENREAVSEDLAKLSGDNFLGDLISDLKNAKSGKSKSETNFYFEITDKNDQTMTKLGLVKNLKGFWKFISL